jgi:acetyltransferase
MPEELSPDSAGAASILGEALAAGRSMLLEPESKLILKSYGVPVVETQIVADPVAACQMAEPWLREGHAVVVKILSDDIAHKSDIRGVRLNLTQANQVDTAAREILEAAHKLRPDARIRGLTVSPYVNRPRAHELIIGVIEDPTFGPLVLFGAGGTAVEVIKDTAFALPPLDMKLARALVKQTRVHRLLQGYRDRPAANLDAIGAALIRLGTLVAERPEIRELDVNPLLADETGVIALDARIRIADPVKLPRVKMAVRPYPAQWTKTCDLPGIGGLLIRPIRPEDERLYETFLRYVTPQDLRFRLFAPQRQLSHGFLARMTQIDYAREIAFVAIHQSSRELLGVVRFIADPDYTRAEYAVIVRSDIKGHGLGWALMQHLMRYARTEGLSELYGSVLWENRTMLDMCRELGFDITSDPDDPSVRHVRLDLMRLAST